MAERTLVCITQITARHGVTRTRRDAGHVIVIVVVLYHIGERLKLEGCDDDYLG